MERNLTYYGDSTANIPKDLQRLFNSLNKIRRYKKGEMIYTQGDKPISFYYLKNGQVKIFLSSEDGYEKTLSIIGGGGILGQAAFFDQLPRISCAKAIYESEIVAINREEFIEKISQNPSLAMSLLKLQATSIRMLSTQLTSVTFYQSDCRIAQTLIAAKLKDNESECYFVYLTHEELAEIVGVSRVTVSNILNSFKKKGYIETSYRKVKIISIEKLEEIANVY